MLPVGLRITWRESRALAVEDWRVVSFLLSMPESCALDLSGRGPMTLEEVGQLFGLTRERVRQIEERALKRYKKAVGRRGRRWLREMSGM